jgi:hypothetical protein
VGHLARIEADFARAETLCAESLALWRSVYGTHGTASALHKLGTTARCRGEPQAGLRLVFESLQPEIGNKQGLLECLAGLAGLAFEWSTSERAVELLATTSAALQAPDAQLAPAYAFDVARDRRRDDASGGRPARAPTAPRRGAGARAPPDAGSSPNQSLPPTQVRRRARTKSWRSLPAGSRTARLRPR